MDLIDRLHAIGSRAAHADSLATEEATKMALVVPFIQALGYDVYDPFVVVPEYTADVGTKRGEKVDYAIMRDSKPIMLVECKKVGVDLNNDPASQLFRYFSVTPARVGILTDGLIYKFYSDLEAKNKMDDRPFLEFDIRMVNDALAAELKAFASDSFDIDSLLLAAVEMKYTRAIKKMLTEEFKTPSDDLVKFFGRRVYSGKFTESVRDKFRDITTRAFHGFISDRIEHRLDVARDLEVTPQEPTAEVEAPLTTGEAALPDGVVRMDGDLVTTTEELEGYLVVKAIIRQLVDAERVTMRDTKSYCGILLDDNNRKPICRLRFNSPTKKYLGLFDEKKNETKVPVSSVDDLYEHADALRQTVRHYIGATTGTVPLKVVGSTGEDHD